MTKRRNFSDQFKAAVALEALRGDKTVQEILAKPQNCAKKHDHFILHGAPEWAIVKAALLTKGRLHRPL